MSHPSLLSKAYLVCLALEARKVFIDSFGKRWKTHCYNTRGTCNLLLLTSWIACYSIYYWVHNRKRLIIVTVLLIRFYHLIPHQIQQCSWGSFLSSGIGCYCICKSYWKSSRSVTWNTPISGASRVSFMTEKTMSHWALCSILKGSCSFSNIYLQITTHSSQM